MNARFTRIFLIQLTIFVFGSVFDTAEVYAEVYAAKKQSKEKAIVETQVELADINSNVMMKSLIADLKRALCERGAYFSSCFVVDPQTCPDIVGNSFSVCLKKERAAPSMLTRSQSVAVADRIGRCTGENLEKSLQPIQPPPQKCKEPRNWF